MTLLDLRRVAVGGLPRALGRALRFPPWFGDGWDAVADCLRDGPPRRLRLHGAAAFARRDPRGWRLFMEVAAEAGLAVTTSPTGGWRPGNGPLAPRARRRP
jgi:hypothetical protein